MKQIAITTILSLLLFSGTAAMAKRPGMLVPPDAELQRLQDEVLAYAFIHHINLTREQRNAIKAQLEDILPELNAARELVVQWQQQEMKPRLKRLLADLKAGRTPQPPDDDAMKYFADLKSMEIELRDKAQNIARKIRELLTDEQRKALKTFRPMDFMSVKGKLHRGLLDSNPLQIIKHIRSASQEEYDFMVHHLQNFKRGTGDKNNDDASRKRYAGRVDALITLMNQIRAMSDEEFDSRLEALQGELTQLLPTPEKRGRRLMRDGRGPHRDMKGPREHRRHDGKARRGHRARLLMRLVLSGEAFYNAL